MALHDFQCISDQPAGVGVNWGILTAAETFLPGELVTVVDAGTLSEFTQAGAVLPYSAIETFSKGGWGVAAASGNTTGTGNNAVVAGTAIPYWPADAGLLFMTNNYFSDAAGTVAIPPGTIRGEAFQITRTATGVFGICAVVPVVGNAAATELCATIKDVLDVNRDPIAVGDVTTGVWVVCELNTLYPNA